MRRKISVLLVLISVLGLGLVGCGKYTSSFSAVGLVSSNTSGSGYMSFYRFKGTKVFKFDIDDDDYGKLVYSGKLEKGSIKVYYDVNDTKQVLFEMKEGEEVRSELADLPEGKLYVIVETDGTASNGNVDFDIE